MNRQRSIAMAPYLLLVLPSTHILTHRHTCTHTHLHATLHPHTHTHVCRPIAPLGNSEADRPGRLYAHTYQRMAAEWVMLCLLEKLDRKQVASLRRKQAAFCACFFLQFYIHFIQKYEICISTSNVFKNIRSCCLMFVECACIHTDTRTRTSTYAQTDAYTCACTYLCVHVCMYVCCMYVCQYACIYACVLAYECRFFASAHE